MRPCKILALILTGSAAIFLLLSLETHRFRTELHAARPTLEIVVSGLGLSDLCVATEARYTRHPAATDRLVPFMNHPGAIEHFPTGSFWAPPPHLRP